MPDTQVERISQLDIGDGKLYEFAGANNGMVFNNVTDALAAIQAGTVANGDVFYIKNDGTSGYPVFIGTSAQITTADNAGKIPAGMLIYCTDDSVNDITALQVSYGNTTVKAKLDELGNTDISGISDGTVTGAISQVNSDLSDLATKLQGEFLGQARGISDSISLTGKTFNTLNILVVRNDVQSPIYEYTLSIPRIAFVNQTEYRFLRTGDRATTIIVGFKNDLVILNYAEYDGNDISATTSIYVYGM